MTPRQNSLDANKRFARRTPGSAQTTSAPDPAGPPPSRITTPAPRAAGPAPAAPYTVRIPLDIAAAWRARVADAGVNQTDAVTAAFQAFMTMDVDDFTAAVLADKRKRRTAS